MILSEILISLLDEIKKLWLGRFALCRSPRSAMRSRSPGVAYFGFCKTLAFCLQVGLDGQVFRFCALAYSFVDTMINLTEAKWEDFESQSLFEAWTRIQPFKICIITQPFILIFGRNLCMYCTYP